MYDLSAYMKIVKQRFTQWFNKKHGRKGTLWEDRFKSTLVEDGHAARVVAAYIDLNPVRAGMVSDPKDYRWCGYGEAVAGKQPARAGLQRVLFEQLSTLTSEGRAAKGGGRIGARCTPPTGSCCSSMGKGLEGREGRGHEEEGSGHLQRRTGAEGLEGGGQAQRVGDAALPGALLDRRDGAGGQWVRGEHFPAFERALPCEQEKGSTQDPEGSNESLHDARSPGAAIGLMPRVRARGGLG